MFRKLFVTSLLAPLCWTSACSDDVQVPDAEAPPEQSLRQGLDLADDLDVTPPAAVSDLEVTAASATSVTLAWTATGDDGHEGSAWFYDLRYSPQPITPENFFFATSASTPEPGQPGSPESITVLLPPDSTHYFALVVVDDQLNESELSNVIEATTSGGTVVYAEGAEDGLAGWAADGLWHVTERRAAEGEHAAWYGQEDTGDYDTGGANAGELISPVISLAGVDNPILLFSELLEAEAGFDTADVLVSLADDPDTFVRFTSPTSDTAGEFQPRSLPLRGFAGADIRITFRFEADETINDFEGWYVDDIRVIDVGDASCVHELCEVGAPLDSTCDTCVVTVCSLDPYCCEVEWDNACVFGAQDSCGLTCDA